MRGGGITGYTLALSWSPEYCRLRTGRPADRRQCSGSNGRFGFIVHGLWPEGRRGRSPQWCAESPEPTAQDLRRNLCTTPSPSLLAREWAKHGSCIVKHPATYFRVERMLFGSLQFPDMARLSREEGLSAGVVRRAFASANPAWPTSAIGVGVNPRGWLQEMHLCYSRRFRPTACDRRRYGPADDRPLRIWRSF